MNNEEKSYLRNSMKRVSRKGIVVEIGSYTGTSAKKIAKGIVENKLKAKFYCVDTFKGSKEPDVENMSQMYWLYKKQDVRAIFEKAMGDLPHKTLVMTSIEASKKFDNESVDFIFLDADHSYESVKEDIEAWWPKLKKGGTFTGHDYNGDGNGVKKAVDEFFNGKAYPVARTVWEIKKP